MSIDNREIDIWEIFKKKKKLKSQVRSAMFTDLSRWKSPTSLADRKTSYHPVENLMTANKNQWF